MKKLSILCVALMLILCACGGGSSKGSDPDYLPGGVSWDITPADLVERNGVTETSNGIYYITQEEFGLSGSIMYLYDDEEKLSLIVFGPDAGSGAQVMTDYKALIEKLTELYGKPDNSELWENDDKGVSEEKIAEDIESGTKTYEIKWNHDGTASKTIVISSSESAGASVGVVYRTSETDAIK